jgi:hypothetical protein
VGGVAEEAGVLKGSNLALRGWTFCEAGLPPSSLWCA